jgi:hypothetical protein
MSVDTEKKIWRLFVGAFFFVFEGEGETVIYVAGHSRFGCSSAKHEGRRGASGSDSTFTSVSKHHTRAHSS